MIAALAAAVGLYFWTALLGGIFVALLGWADEWDIQAPLGDGRE